MLNEAATTNKIDDRGATHPERCTLRPQHGDQPLTPSTTLPCPARCSGAQRAPQADSDTELRAACSAQRAASVQRVALHYELHVSLRADRHAGKSQTRNGRAARPPPPATQQVQLAI
jgi:hypothetical protein